MSLKGTPRLCNRLLNLIILYLYTYLAIQSVIEVNILKTFQISEIRKIVDGELIQGSDTLSISNVIYFNQDKVLPNTLIFLKNKSQIKYEYISNSTEIAIITDEITQDIKSNFNWTVILVKAVEIAYWKFVEFYRSLFDIPVIAITGTCGKTTTKDMIKCILSKQFNVQGTKSTANGRTAHLGYLLGIDESTDVGVFETAVGKPGDLSLAFRYFKPSIGVMLNIGIDHLYWCKTLEGYIGAKVEMVKQLNDNGTLILNRDDTNIQNIDLSNFKGTIIYFGIHNFSNFMASNIKYGKDGMDFTLKYKNNKYHIFVPGYGEHQVYNALGAIAAVSQLGVDVKEAAEGLLDHVNLPHHHQFVKGINGCSILDDSWKTNPTCLEAAFETLNGVAGGKKRVALIGQINGLGSYTVQSASLVGTMIAEKGVDILITVGPTSAEIAKQARSKGLEGDIYTFRNIKDVYPFVSKLLDKNMLLLVKCGMYDIPFRKMLKKLIE